MRTFFTIIMLCIMLAVQAKPMKVNYKFDQKPFSFKIEKVDVVDGKTVVYIQVKQFSRFSYNISFEDCVLYTAKDPEGVKGELTGWNEDKKIPSAVKPISDEEFEKFQLTFPSASLAKGATFKIKIGNIQDREQTEIVAENVSIRK